MVGSVRSDGKYGAVRSLVFIFGMLLLGFIMSFSTKPQPPFQPGVIVKTLSDGKLYLVTYVGSHGADLAPCLGNSCKIQAWSAARLMITPHQDVYPGDPNYSDVRALFGK